MAATKSKPKAKRASNYRVGGNRYTKAMRVDLVKAVIAADKAGTPRKAVFESYAKAWSKELGKTVTPKNVMATYQNYKAKYGNVPVKKRATSGGAKRGRKPAAAKKPAPTPANNGTAHNPASAVVIADLVKSLDSYIADMAARMAELSKNHEAAVKRAEKAEAQLAKIRKAVS